jgi:microcystin-dependent protein
MADPFVAEIRVVGFNFAPLGWATCDGQLMPLSQNPALFSLLGTTYGGDGKSTFALPDLQGRAPMHPGQGAGLSLRDLGEEGGTETVTLLQNEMPAHTHALSANALPASASLAAPTQGLGRSVGGSAYKASPPATAAMSPQAVGLTGGDSPHNNLMPYLTLNYIIALQGVFPARP